MEIPDEVRRELEIQAPRERVWAALTEAGAAPAVVPGQAAEIELRPGGAPSWIEWQAGESRRHGRGRGAAGPLRVPVAARGSTRRTRPCRSRSRSSSTVRRPVSWLVESDSPRSPINRASAQKDNDEGWAHELGSSRSTWRPRDEGRRGRGLRGTRRPDTSARGATSSRRTVRSPRRSSRVGSRSHARRSRSTSTRWRKRGSPPPRASAARPATSCAPGPSPRRRPGCARSARCGINASPRSRSSWSRCPRARQEGGSDDRSRASGDGQGTATRPPGRDRPSAEGMPPRDRPVPEGSSDDDRRRTRAFEPVRKSVRVDRTAGRGVPTLHGAHRPMVAGRGLLTGCRRAVRRRRQGGAGRLRASRRWSPLRGHVRGCRRRLG